MTRRILPIAVVLTLLLKVALAASNPASLLIDAQRARKQLRFIGREITETHTGAVSSISRLRVYQDCGRSRLDYESGPMAGRSVADDGRWLIQLDPKARQATRIPTSHLDPQTSLLQKNYRIRFGAKQMIAGRSAQVLLLEPRRSGSPSRRFWIDRANRMILRTDQVLEGRMLTSSRFTQISYSTAISPSLFAVPKGWRVTTSAGGSRALTRKEAEAQAGFGLIIPSSLPGGYIPDGYSLQRVECPMVQVRLTDGVNTLSVFQCQMGSGCGFGPRGGGGGGRGMGWGRRGTMGGPGPNGNGCGACRLLGTAGNRMLAGFGGGRRFIVMGNASEELMGAILRQFTQLAEK